MCYGSGLRDVARVTSLNPDA